MGSFGKKKEDKKAEPQPTPVRLPDEVDHIKQIFTDKHWNYTGNDDDSSSDTHEYESLDIVRQYGQLYLVHTKTHHYSSYDRYASSMNTTTERSSFQICPITEDMLEHSKEQLLAFMETAPCIHGSCQEAPEYSAPSAYFICKYTRKTLGKEKRRLLAEENKKKGKAKPNAVFVPAHGKAKPMHIDDFSPDGLAFSLDCDEVKLGQKDDDPAIGYFYDAKIVYGRSYNARASAMLGTALEGIVIICGRSEAEECQPFAPEEAKLVAGFCNAIKS